MKPVAVDEAVMARVSGWHTPHVLEVVSELPVSWLVWHNHGNPDHTTKVFHLAMDGVCKECPI